MSKLYIVATPIGNLEDITLRALETLKSVDLICCEDTRMTKRLLDRYEINKPLISYHQHSKLAKIDHLVEELRLGKNLAVVSDAGTPGISDPGNVLVSEVVKKLGEEVTIIPIPGPSALITLASVAGVPTDQFLFLGFLPHKKGRETLFKEIVEEKRTVIFYESPHRIIKTLEKLTEVIGERPLVVGRELTKIYETIYHGSAKEVLARLQKSNEIKGEFVVLVSPHKR